MEWKDSHDGPGRYVLRECDNPASHPCGDFLLIATGQNDLERSARFYDHCRWFKLPADPDAPNGGKEARGASDRPTT